MCRVLDPSSVLLLLAIATTAAGQDFNVDVGLPGSQPSSSYAAAGQAGFWNSVLAESGADDVLLVDVNGNSTSVGFHQIGGMELVTTVDSSVSGDDAALLNDYVATHSLTLENCMYLNGLENGTYEVITYAWMPNSPMTLQEVFFDGLPGSTLVGGPYSGQHEQGITYSREVFEVTFGHIGWHAGIPVGFPAEPGAAFNGFQIRRLATAVPVSSTRGITVMGVLLLLLGGLVLRRRRGP